MREFHKVTRSSKLFYGIFNASSHSNYSISTDAFRLITRRAINRVHASNSYMFYKKAAYAASGLRMASIYFDGKVSNIQRNKLSLAINSLALYTNAGYKASIGLTLGMEANPVLYGTNYINTTEEAIDLVRRVGSDGFKLNLDIGTMIYNNESISILENDIASINHVHISEPNLKAIQERELHHEIKNVLTDRYYGFISIEMGKDCSLEAIQSCMLRLYNELCKRKIHRR